MFPLGAAQTEAAFCIFDTVRLVDKSLFALSVCRFDTSRVDFRRSASPNFVALLIRFRLYRRHPRYARVSTFSTRTGIASSHLVHSARLISCASHVRFQATRVLSSPVRVLSSRHNVQPSWTNEMCCAKVVNFGTTRSDLFVPLWQLLL